MKEKLKNKLEVGQKVYSKLETGFDEYTVSWVGSKFFKISEDIWERKIPLEDMYAPRVGYSIGFRLYPSKQAIIDEEQLRADTTESYKLIDTIRGYINSHKVERDGIEVLRKIAAIVPPQG